MEILNYEDQPRNAYALGVFDVYMGPSSDLVIGRMKVCRSKKGHLYVTRPSYKKGEFEGKAVWGTYDYYRSAEKEKGFLSSVLELVKPFVKELPSSNSPSEW